MDQLKTKTLEIILVFKSFLQQTYWYEKGESVAFLFVFFFIILILITLKTF